MAHGMEHHSLSAQSLCLWGKTGGRENPQLWGSLALHMGDAASTAGLLWNDWLPQSVKRFVCTRISLEDSEVEALVKWLAGVHDMGKATPSFQSKVPEHAEKVVETGLRFAPHCESHSHAFMSEVILNRWGDARKWSESSIRACAAIVGGHHGVNPNQDVLGHIQSRARINPLATLGDEVWEQKQDELITWAFFESGAYSIEGRIRECNIPASVQVILVAVVIVADWISSNVELFPLSDTFGSWYGCNERAQLAWTSLHLPRYLALPSLEQDINLQFHARFTSIPYDAQLRPVQEATVEVARTAQDSCLIIVEDAMGSGKTEAALLAAETLMMSTGAGGLAFLLPTQATSNAMFGRIKSWLQSLLSDQLYDSVQDLHLLHGKAALNEDFASLPVWRAGWMGDEANTDDAIVAHQWFGGRKRGLLAPFVVGTVDQLLMAALRSKHVHLRHLGLSGKVVIIDEVHAYDAYMSTYLDRVLYYLGQYSVPVILLSATLPPTRRLALLQAYRGQQRRRTRRSPQLELPPRTNVGDPCYPLISCTKPNRESQIMYRTVSMAESSKSVKIECMNDDDANLLEELQRSLVDGGCVCVLRNTVTRAQRTYRFLCEHLDTDIILAHSRYIAVDRAKRDAWLAEVLGPETSKRPHSLIVVSTQILEQSLDVDLDLLITDVAPIDLLLQRMGRLHRHERKPGGIQRPQVLSAPRCVLTGVIDWNEPVPVFARGIERIYESAVLLRTIVAIRSRVDAKGYLTLPYDIAPLVEDVYENKVRIPSIWEEVYTHALQKENETFHNKYERAQNWLLPKLGAKNLNGWMRNPVSIGTEAEGRAAVRDSEESIEVVIVQESKGSLRLPVWVAEAYNTNGMLGVPTDTPPDEVARIAAICTVNLPPALSAPYIAESVLCELWNRNPCYGWQDSLWLKGLLPLVIDSRGEAIIECQDREYHLRYTKDYGLEIL